MKIGTRIRFEKGLPFKIGERNVFRIERGEEGVIVKQEENDYHVRIDSMNTTVSLTEDVLDFYTVISHDKTRYIKWEYEDQLDFAITDNMFKVSKVIDGVRMYPYIEVGFNRYYLEDEKENVYNEEIKKLKDNKDKLINVLYNQSKERLDDNRWYGDMVALEDIENCSLCIKTDEGIRNVKSKYDADTNMTVFVCNFPTVEQQDSLRFIIKKGQYVRYKKSYDI